jgi:hypothetical protein
MKKRAAREVAERPSRLRINDCGRGAGRGRRRCNQPSKIALQSHVASYSPVERRGTAGR